MRFRIAPADATPDGHPLLASERSQPAPTRKERCDLRWEIERHLGGVEEWTPSHDLSLSTFGLLRKCQRALVQPTEREPVVREELGTIHSHDKCGVIEG